MIQIHGVITDPTGKPVPRALIELRALSSTSEVLMGSAMTFKCEQDGGYRFQLAAGTYDVYAQNDLCGDMDYMGTGVVAAQSTDGPLNSILVDSGINLTPPLLDRAVEAMQRSEAAAEATAEDRLQTGNDVVTAEQAMQVATEQAAAASTSAATAGSQVGDAATSAGDAAGSASRAQKWADNPVDVAVVPGKHSALHHATKASASASESATSATAAAASASTASAKATSASTSATTATAKASEAAASASTAATHASAANSSKVAAATSATNAGTHASNAEKADQAAEGAKVVTLDNAAKVGTLAEQVTADRTQVQEKATQVAANAATVAGQTKEVSTNADTVSQAKTAIQGMRDVVVAKTTQAQAAADTASSKASQAAQDQASANASSLRASVSEGMAEAWAQNPEGSDINGRPGEFSALHWALQAQKWAQAITSQLVWAGPWNAAAGAPAVPAANQGVPFYRISHPGVIASVSYVAGDYLHWDPATRTWFKIDGSDAVISVNGMTGAVVLSAADVGARPASWVPGWADITNKPVTMPPSEHSHPWSQLSNVPIYASRWPTLAEVGAAAASHTHPWSQLTGIPTYATRWPAWGEVTDKPDLAAASHRHPWNQIDQIPVTASRWPTWSEVTGKPSIAAAVHRHPWSELDEVPATASRWPSYDEVTDKPDFAAAAHRHPWSQLDQVPVQATRWPAWGEVTGKPGTMPPSTHNHPWSELTGVPTQATRWPAWAEVTGKPATMPPAAHAHAVSEVSGLQAALDGKAESTHTHTPEDLGIIAKKYITVAAQPGVEAGKYYPVMFSKGQNGLNIPIYISTRSSGGGDPMNNCSFDGVVRVSGWSDKSSYIDGIFTKYSLGEDAIKGICLPTEAEGVAVVYVEARAFPVTVATDSDVTVTTSAGNMGFGTSVFFGGVTDFTGSPGTKTTLFRFTGRGRYHTHGTIWSGDMASGLTLDVRSFMGEGLYILLYCNTAGNAFYTNTIWYDGSAANQFATNPFNASGLQPRIMDYLLSNPANGPAYRLLSIRRIM